MPRAIGFVKDPRHQQNRRLSPAEKTRRRSRPPASRKNRREADQAHQETGRLPRRAGGRPLQAGALPVLSEFKSETRKANGKPFVFSLLTAETSMRGDAK